MRNIYKYELRLAETCAIEMPVNAKVLTVQAQHGRPCLWALVDDEAPREVRSFRIIGTGHRVDVEGLPFAAIYVGTFQLEGGALVFHVFEAVP